jgi:hypothetical protein
MTMPRESNEARLSTADFAAAATPTDQMPVERQAQDRTPSNAPLFIDDEATGFRNRWVDIQASFVDEPRQAVEQADALVAEVMQRLAQVFADERQRLEQHWDHDDQTAGEAADEAGREARAVDTEELRQALRRYRSFFDRLLTM